MTDPAIIERLDSIAEQLDRLATPVEQLSFNLKDTATVLGISLPLVRRLIAEGHLAVACYPGMKKLRIPRTSIDAFLAASTVHPTTTLEIAS